MGRQLTIGQTAKRLGLEVDTVRKLERAGKIRAVRTRGGHRRFTEEEIDRYRKSHRRSGTAQAGSRRRPSAARRATPARTTLNRHPRTGEFAAQDACFPDDFDDIDEDLPNDEFDEQVRDGIYSAPPPALRPPRVVLPPPAPATRPSLFEARHSPVASAAANLSGFMEQLRLQRIKGHGRAAMPYNLPAEWQGRVIAELERYVTPIQFPADLSDAKAAEIVRAQVAEVLRPYHEAEEKAARQKQAKAEADRRKAALIAREALLQKLIAAVQQYLDGQITVEEAAAILGRHPETIRRAVRTGALPDGRTTARGHHRIRRGDLEKLAAPVPGRYDPHADAQDIARRRRPL